MRIKHWQGYGTVNARKISSSPVDNGIKLVIEVTGNHEYGIVRNDVYDVHRWLVTRFAKDCPDYRCIQSVNVISDENGDVDKARYEIVYRPRKA